MRPPNKSTTTHTAPPILYTHDQAAEHLGLHPVTLLRLARRGKIEHARVGRRLKFTPGMLHRYVDSVTVLRWS